MESLNKKYYLKINDCMVIYIATAARKGCSQVNIILLLYSLSNQLALFYAELFLVAHHLTFLVLIHLDIVECVHNTVPT